MPHLYLETAVMKKIFPSDENWIRLHCEIVILSPFYLNLRIDGASSILFLLWLSEAFFHGSTDCKGLSKDWMIYNAAWSFHAKCRLRQKWIMNIWTNMKCYCKLLLIILGLLRIWEGNLALYKIWGCLKSDVSFSEISLSLYGHRQLISNA